MLMFPKSLQFSWATNPSCMEMRIFAWTVSLDLSLLGSTDRRRAEHRGHRSDEPPSLPHWSNHSAPANLSSISITQAAVPWHRRPPPAAHGSSLSRHKLNSSTSKWITPPQFRSRSEHLEAERQLLLYCGCTELSGAYSPLRAAFLMAFKTSL